MPCVSDYMEPNTQEIESRAIAQLLIYVDSKLSTVNLVDQMVIRAAQDAYGAPAHINTLTNRLCRAIRNMSEAELDHVVYNARDPESRKLADWWERHETFDSSPEAAEHSTKLLKLGRDIYESLTGDEQYALDSYYEQRWDHRLKH